MSAPNPPSNRFPIRFGVFDLIGASVLFGIHFGFAHHALCGKGPSADITRLAVAAVLSAAFAFGAAYLAFRYITSRGTTSYLWRLITLVLVDLLLISISLLVFLGMA